MLDSQDVGIQCIRAQASLMLLVPVSYTQLTPTHSTELSYADFIVHSDFRFHEFLLDSPTLYHGYARIYPNDS